ncbi:MAG: histidine kinase [Bacteroidales bacterium]|nr:histidine kinase [Bacteroidales bacterium]
MQNLRRRNLILNTTQIVVWAGVFLVPALVTWTTTGHMQQALFVFRHTARMVLPLFLLYGLNYYLLVPQFLYGGKGKVKWFYILNVLLLVGYNLYRFWPRGPMTPPEEVVNQIGMRNIWAFFLGGIIAAVFIQVLMILLAVGLRHLMRMNDREMQFEEERRKTAEAELTWLKHQLNPHFLFNTLNNISSLTQIDPDKAQESIGQLSDLLRYALYDSEAEKVQLASEIEFMDNYIDLMALRCNELTTVEKHLEAPSKPVEVAPLLFISLVENAFKHGVNARHPSFVKVAMQMEGDDLVFTCDNTLFEKQGTDHIGSGIGLENMKRRLELLYPGRYTYEQSASDDTYHVQVTLKSL